MAILGDTFPYPMTSTSLDLPELQGEPEYVAAEKCKWATQYVDGPVMVEDTSLCYNALGGLPGVYIKVSPLHLRSPSPYASIISPTLLCLSYISFSF